MPEKLSPDEIQELLSRPTISVVEAARILGIGRNSAYEAARTGDIQSLTIGKRVLVLTIPLRKKLGME